MAIVVGAALRFSNLGGVPPALNQDEAVFAYDAYSLALTGRDHHGHPFPWANLESFGAWTPALLTFVLAPAVALLGLHVEVVRAVSAAIGTLAIPVVFLLGNELFGRRSVGVLAAWFVAISPWHVHNSRFANVPTVVPTMIALTMLLFLWSVHRGNHRGLVAAAFTAGLTVGSYSSMYVYVPLLGLVVLVLYGPTLLRFSRETLAYATLAFVVTAGPVLFIAARDPGGRTRAEQVSVFRTPGVDLAFLTRQYLSYFSPDFLFVAGDGNPMHIPPGFGAELWSLMPFLLVGLAWLIVTALDSARRSHRKSALFLLAALVIYPFPGCLTLPSPHALRGAHVIPVLALIAAVGTSGVADALSRLLRRTRPHIARGVVAMLFLLGATAVGVELLGRYKDYFNEYPRKVAPHFHSGLREALEYARAHEAEHDEIWVTDVNQPYIYVLFFTKWSPSDVHINLQVRRAPPAFNRVRAIGKYRFGPPPSVAPAELALLAAVRTTDGRVGYEVRGGEVRSRGRILLVHRP